MFLAGAITDPDAVTDHVDEATLVTDYPGVDPIACLQTASAALAARKE